MKKLIFLTYIALYLTGCGGETPSNPEIDKLKAEKDSIARIAAGKDSTLNSFIESLNEIEENLNEVKQKQGIISSTAKEGVELDNSTKDRINEDINFINDLLDENKKKMEGLKSKLKKSNLKITELEKMIQMMTNQLKDKDTEISSLKDQLESMNIKITELNTTVNKLEEESSKKTEVINQQTTKMNTAWYALGTYAELKQNKIINKEGGFLGLGKKQALKSDFNQDYFTKVDITNFKTISLNCKAVKLITNHPSESYKLNMDGKKVKSLSINNPESFWKSSKYLVISIEK